MIVSACWGKKGKFESGVTGILDRSDTLIHRGGKKYRLTSTCLKSCNAEFLFIRPRGNHHETHLSTIRYAEKANPWFQGTHEDRRWGGRYPGSPRQGTGSPRSIAFKTTAIRFEDHYSLSENSPIAQSGRILLGYPIQMLRQ